jgi:hypothetical protein
MVSNIGILLFAVYPKDYVWWHNSSTMIATWLEEMGVEVRGPGLLASWEVGGSGVSGSP